MNCDEQPQGSTEGGGHGVLRALLADDDEDLRPLLAELLGLYGFQVTEASNGRTALALIAEAAARMDPGNRFDLIVLDVTMPLHSGLEILRIVRLARWPVPVIVMTAHGPHVVEEALKSGAAAVLSKPFSIDQFRLRVAETMTARSTERSSRSQLP